VWRPRSGAIHPRNRLHHELARQHCYVSVEGQQIRPRHVPGTQNARSATPRKLNDDQDVVIENELSRLSQDYLSILPVQNAFTSPFESAATTRSRATHDGDRAGIKTVTTSQQVSKFTGNAKNMYNKLNGLKSWVIIPEPLQPNAAVEAYLASESGEESLEITNGDSIIGQAGKFAMRTSVAREGSLLGLTLDYTRYLHDALGNQSVCGSNTFLGLVEIVFTSKRSGRLEQRGFQAENVVCWGWILAADTADLAVKRMHTVAHLTNYGRDASRTCALPYFLFTIILRSGMLSGSSLTLLVNVLTMRGQVGSASAPMLPDSTTAMILLVRLVRHARRVAPVLLPAIADLSETLLKAEYTSNPSSAAILSRLTRNYNRMLSIFSVATSQHPFQFVTIQQRAQLKVVRQMASMDPAIPVTREGYQALTKVQLAHKKTPAERDWAATKRGSWPPWREDKLGISEDLEYPGSQSRALVVLHRQTEAGYMQTDWDRAAEILAGWDTDKSPTIQTRAVLRRAPLTWLQSLVESLVKQENKKSVDITEGSEIWDARIRATRSIREAWACFCAWDTSTNLVKRLQHPYFAMFGKLAPRLQSTTPGVGQLAGDGKELQPQSVSPRDYLHVPVEPPSFHIFYHKMRRDGVKPGGRLLALLLDHARTLAEGIMYLEESTLPEVKKDVLLNAHKYDSDFIRSELKFMHPVVLTSFLTMLWRIRKRSNKTWFLPASQAERDVYKAYLPAALEEISAQMYVRDLVDHVQLSAKIGNKILETLARGLKATTDARTLAFNWRALLDFLKSMEASGTDTDMATFYAVASVIEHITSAHPNFQFETQLDRRKNSTKNGRLLAKRLFIQAVIDPTSDTTVSSEDAPMSAEPRLQLPLDSKGTYLERLTADDPATRMRWLPDSASARILEVPFPAALHLLMRLLHRGRETGSILRLLRWMDRFATELRGVMNETENGERQMRHAICVAAMTVEDDARNKYPAPLEEITEVWELIVRNGVLGGWPADEELEEYLMKGRPADRLRGRERGDIERRESGIST
jgi:hypothetical protein